MAAPRLHHVTAQAVTPDQLLPYVGAVSDMQTTLAGDCVLHYHGDRAVLVGYPLHSPHDNAAAQKTLDAALAAALSRPGLAHITVLAAQRPHSAPEHAESTEDSYWAVPLPPLPPKQKLRHMLHRAAREITLSATSGPGSWTEAHKELVQTYIRTRPLEPGTRHIFLHLDAYLAAAPEALLWSAHNADGQLAGCALGDYSALSTAFYMFAFRSPTAPPGTADTLLAAVLDEGARRGHSHCNLGLGINPRIAFFKKKWQATAFLPCVQTSWDLRPARTSWLSRFFSQ